MHILTFYPLGNADCCKIDLSNGKKLLFDYAHSKESEDESDPKTDLAKALREDLEISNRNYFDVVGFTHGDLDHLRGSSDFFFLEHDEKYQSEDRIKIKELWVPAAMIVEKASQEEAKVIRKEARYRLKKGKGIRVFSRPERLKEWLENEGLTLDDRKHLIIDAGQLVPEYDKDKEGVEFFVHSPFALRKEDELEDRNENALILQAVFNIDGYETKFMLIGDSTFEALSNIVYITKYHKREERLGWDIYDIPHHCSYKALSDEKGKDITEPEPDVDWLLKQGKSGGKLISCSNPIPDNDDNNLPPHRQTANYYKQIESNIGGEFKVTMEHPTISKPKPLVITIDKWGATIKKIITGGGSGAISKPAPRAGRS